MNLHEFLDIGYNEGGESELLQRIKSGEDVNACRGDLAETPLHVATRRFRTGAVVMLLDHGAEIDAENGYGKTAYTHAARRRFGELAELLKQRGANTHLNPADQFAVAIVENRLDDAKEILKQHPEVAKTGNPEEDRLLADVAGRNSTEPVKLLIKSGADLTATALDSGTPLHQSAWFGQPANARLLIDAGAPLDLFEPTHNYSPIGWAVHGSRYSGGANERESVYVELVKIFLAAGASLHYPDQPQSDAYFQQLLSDATPAIKRLLEAAANN